MSAEELAQLALAADEAYLDALPAQLRYVCIECGRAHMGSAQRRREEAKRRFLKTAGFVIDKDSP